MIGRTHEKAETREKAKLTIRNEYDERMAYKANIIHNHTPAETAEKQKN